ARLAAERGVPGDRARVAAAERGRAAAGARDPRALGGVSMRAPRRFLVEVLASSVVLLAIDVPLGMIVRVTSHSRFVEALFASVPVLAHSRWVRRRAHALGLIWEEAAAQVTVANAVF